MEINVLSDSLTPLPLGCCCQSKLLCHDLAVQQGKAHLSLGFQTLADSSVNICGMMQAAPGQDVLVLVIFYLTLTAFHPKQLLENLQTLQYPSPRRSHRSAQEAAGCTVAETSSPLIPAWSPQPFQLPPCTVNISEQFPTAFFLLGFPLCSQERTQHHERLPMSLCLVQKQGMGGPAMAVTLRSFYFQCKEEKDPLSTTAF